MRGTVASAGGGGPVRRTARASLGLRTWAGLTLVVVLGGCEAAAPRTPPPTSTPSASAPVSPGGPTPAGPSSAGPSPPGPSPPEPVRLEPVELVADLSEAPVSWERVVFLPFGPARDELGSELRRRYASIPVVPPSLAIDHDGSLWILDYAKRRVVHFRADGRLLEDFGGLDANRFDPFGQDMAFVGDGLYLLEEIHHVRGSLLRTVSAEGIGPRIPLTVDKEPVVVQNFVAPLPDLAGFAHGALDETFRPPPGGGPTGDIEIDPATGRGTIVDGFALADGDRMDLQVTPGGDGRRVAVLHGSGAGASLLPVRVRVRPAADEPDVPATVTWRVFGASVHSIVAWVQLSPSRRADQERFGGGQWMLEAFDDGEPLVWEPIAISPLPSTQWRRLAVGFDGSIYQMLSTRTGMLIVRRPS